MHKRKRAFTLIELLIVVAIIGILAAIAVPNFLNAQTRAKIGRVKSDMKAISTALEMYRLDHGSYSGDCVDAPGTLKYLGWRNLTTPVAYLSAPPRDPFAKFHTGENGPQPNIEVGTGSVNHPNHVGIWHASPVKGPLNTYLITSNGPDDIDTTTGGYGFQQSLYPWSNSTSDKMKQTLFYDPSNGLRSHGEILYAGGLKPSGSQYAAMSEGYDVLYQNQ